ncbi:MAG: NYN domain-containing protein [Verrucomicrobia bacterium]|nr:NYN domain-containing protein [Verrucomicrobiota bacterium]
MRRGKSGGRGRSSIVLRLHPRRRPRGAASPTTSSFVGAILPYQRGVKSAAKPLSARPEAPRLLVAVDESNLLAGAWLLQRNLDWQRLREHLAGDRHLLEMVVFAGLPPAMPEWQTEREKKQKFLHWLRQHGFLVVTAEGAPMAAEDNRYKANVDVLLALEVMELAEAMRPDVVVLVTGDADFAHLALRLRRRGIRVEAAAIGESMSNALRGASNTTVDLGALLKSFEAIGGK